MAEAEEAREQRPTTEDAEDLAEDSKLLGLSGSQTGSECMCDKKGDKNDSHGRSDIFLTSVLSSLCYHIHKGTLSSVRRRRKKNSLGESWLCNRLLDTSRRPERDNNLSSTTKGGAKVAHRSARPSRVMMSMIANATNGTNATVWWYVRSCADAKFPTDSLRRMLFSAILGVLWKTTLPSAFPMASSGRHSLSRLCSQL